MEWFVTAVLGATCRRHTGAGIFPTSIDGVSGSEREKFKSERERLPKRGSSLCSMTSSPTRHYGSARMYVCVVITYSKSKDQPGRVADPARGQLNRENDFFCPRSRLIIWSSETGSAVRPGPACSSPYSGWIWCPLTTGFLPISVTVSIYSFKPPYAIGPVSSLSGHAIAYRWRSMPRIRRQRQ